MIWGIIRRRWEVIKMKARININTTTTIKKIAETRAKQQKLNMRQYLEDLIVLDATKEKGELNNGK